MAHCRLCHGALYTGNPPAPSCIACHKQANSSNDAPHAANWLSGNVNGLKHSTTDSGNAPACYQCHAGGKFSHPAPVPAPAGTAPGCFNGTMCHNVAGHTFTVADHMMDAIQNLASCQQCHATPASGTNPRFNVVKGTGVLNANNGITSGCENCHNGTAPQRPGLAHPYIWLPGRGGSPSSTPQANHGNAQNVIKSCGLCHGGAALAGGGPAYPGGISPPACFTPSPAMYGGTACHFTTPVTLTGVNAGLSVGCGSCHGSPSHSSTGEPSSTGPTDGPNRAFKHSPHFSNIGGSGAALTCDVCHYGLGSGTASHSTRQVFGAVTAAVSIKQSRPGRGVQQQEHHRSLQPDWGQPV